MIMSLGKWKWKWSRANIDGDVDADADVEEEIVDDEDDDIELIWENKPYYTKGLILHQLYLLQFHIYHLYIY